MEPFTFQVGYDIAVTIFAPIERANSSCGTYSSTSKSGAICLPHCSIVESSLCMPPPDSTEARLYALHFTAGTLTPNPQPGSCTTKNGALAAEIASAILAEVFFPLPKNCFIHGAGTASHESGYPISNPMVVFLYTRMLIVVPNDQAEGPREARSAFRGHSQAPCWAL